MGLHSNRLGINQFAYMTNEEFRKTVNGFKRSNSTRSGFRVLPRDHAGLKYLPEKIDWRDNGCVTRVKNQGECSSCYAFAATGAIECQHYRRTQNLVSLSEQNLIDCSEPQGNDACIGGRIDNSFEYIMKNGGIHTDKTYPYMGTKQTCRYDWMERKVTIVRYKNIATENELALKEAVADVGPVSVSIDASQETFQLYQSGVYYDQNCSSVQLTHAVLVVGYDKEADKDYWIVKNSWGEHWGEHGYIRMSRNKSNQCGIATDALHPIV